MRTLCTGGSAALGGQYPWTLPTPTNVSRCRQMFLGRIPHCWITNTSNIPIWPHAGVCRWEFNLTFWETWLSSSSVWHTLLLAFFSSTRSSAIMFLQSSSFVYQRQLAMRLQEHQQAQPLAEAELRMLCSSTALLSISIRLCNFKGKILSLLLLKIREGGFPKDLFLTSPKLHVSDHATTQKLAQTFHFWGDYSDICGTSWELLINW